MEPTTQHQDTPVEVVLSKIGSVASGAGGWIFSRGSSASSHARPWFEFIDPTMFRLPSVPEIGERLKFNLNYFTFNYVLLGFGLAIVSAITKPLTLIGVLGILGIYFHLFGSEAGEEVRVFNMSLDKNEKVGVLVLVSAFVFYFAVGHFEFFMSIVTGMTAIALIHGILRKVPENVSSTETSNV